MLTFLTLLRALARTPDAVLLPLCYIIVVCVCVCLMFVAKASDVQHDCKYVCLVIYIYIYDIYC